jgi:apolipoprotein N-acyltransferase
MMNVALALVALRRPRRELLWLAPLLLLYMLPALPAPTAGSHTARLVQPNVHPDDMQHRDRAVQQEHLARMRQLSTATATGLDATSPELLIWPEYPVPGYFFDDPGFRAYMEDLARQTNAHVILNAIAFRDDDRGRPLNSALVLSPRGELLLDQIREAFKHLAHALLVELRVLSNLADNLGLGHALRSSHLRFLL